MIIGWLLYFFIEAEAEPGETTATKEGVEEQFDFTDLLPDMGNLAEEFCGCSFNDPVSIDENFDKCLLKGRGCSEDTNALLDGRKTEMTEEEEDDDSYNNKDSSIKNLNMLLDMVKEVTLPHAEEGLADVLNSFHAAEDMLDSIGSEQPVN